MCSIDLDRCEVWSETPRKARKPHGCNGCGIVIVPGQPYLVHFNIYDGDPTREAMCFACWCAREQFADAHGQSIAPSILIEMLRECIGENDDEEDVWRPVLASVLSRYRVARRAA